MMTRIEVLDKGHVELIDFMGDDLAIVNAARVSYLGESQGDEADRALLCYLYEHEHGTPFETVVFKFEVKAPELVFRQWVRHRIGTFNVQSRRYTDVEEDDFYVPEGWIYQSDDYCKEYNAQSMINDLISVYENCISQYHRALKLGIHREQARLFLPGFAVYSTFVWTVNARSLMNFLRLRLGDGAQWEIQQYAEAISTVFRERLPWTAEEFEKDRRGV